MNTEFLVIYESEWNNKYSFQCKLGKIGDTIKEIVEDYDLKGLDEGIDYDKLNSEDPYDVGTSGLGFYDIEFHNEEEGEYKGRIMIFQIELKE